MDAHKIDPLLIPFMKATEEREGEPLGRLFAEHVTPMARRILMYKLRADHRGPAKGFTEQDGEEIYYELQLNILRRLRELKKDPHSKPIINLRSYVATATYNAFDEYLRRKYPQRRGLKDRLRYYLTSRPGFALWEDSAFGLIAGLEAWREDGVTPAAARDPQGIEELIGQVQERLETVALQHLAAPRLIQAVLSVTGSPVIFDELTTVIAGLQNTRGEWAEPVDEGSVRLLSASVKKETNPESIAERHQLIRLLWDEICRLPRGHRVALLFNLRNAQGANIIAFLPLTGVASFEQIADALEIPIEQFEALWTNLPLDDLSIALYLGATRQQVINLRKNARHRLQRLLDALEGKK